MNDKDVNNLILFSFGWGIMSNAVVFAIFIMVRAIFNSSLSVWFDIFTELALMIIGAIMVAYAIHKRR